MIGGKSQRVDSSGAVIEPDKPRRKPRKTRKQAKGRPRIESQSKTAHSSAPAPSAPSVPPRETKELSHEAIVARLNHLLLFKPLLPPQRAYVSEHRIFLLRNLDKVSSENSSSVVLTSKSNFNFSRSPIIIICFKPLFSCVLVLF